MVTYPNQAPGVYVIEQKSGSAPIVGVGTSTAGFIGVFTLSSSSPPVTPAQPTVQMVGSKDAPVDIATGDGTKKDFELPKPSGLSEAGVVTDSGFGFLVDGRERTAVTLKNEGGKAFVTFTGTAPTDGAKVTGFFSLSVPAAPAPTPTPAPSSTTLSPDLAIAGDVKLCTNFTEFKKFFGDFSAVSGQNLLAHAVFGFFRNGGTRCYVVRIESETDINLALEKFEAVDEIAIVAAPGITTVSTLGAIVAHCENLQDRVAVLDAPERVEDTAGSLKLDLLDPNNTAKVIPGNSEYAALYFPWIKVFDPVTKANNPSGDGLKVVPPSGHVMGMYARVDAQRGVFKAPANEPLLGAVGLKYDISKAKQEILNPNGINCIRNLNGNIRVWGARTLGGNANGEFKYINVRRLFNYLRESIDEGTQWTVFEPNSPDLWARIRRSVSAFLLTVWRSGALFGDTPEQAFYVKCDEETNPPEIREQGQVVTEIGVAVVKPAEFVIFTLSQWARPGGS
jgi:hypothetical protein